MSLPCGSCRDSWERPCHCLGTRSSGCLPVVEEVVVRGLGLLHPSAPDSGRAWDCAEHTKSCLGVPCAGPAQQPPMARTPRCLAGDQHLRLRAGHGVKTSMQGVGLLRGGGQEGLQAGSWPAGPKPQRWRPEKGLGHLGTPRASSRIADSSGTGWRSKGGIWKPERASRRPLALRRPESG